MGCSLGMPLLVTKNQWGNVPQMKTPSYPETLRKGRSIRVQDRGSETRGRTPRPFFRSRKVKFSGTLRNLRTEKQGQKEVRGLYSKYSQITRPRLLVRGAWIFRYRGPKFLYWPHNFCVGPCRKLKTERSWFLFYLRPFGHFRGRWPMIPHAIFSGFHLSVLPPPLKPGSQTPNQAF